MQKTNHLFMALPAAVVLALGGCGRDVDSSSSRLEISSTLASATSGSSRSIKACFTANKTVNYALMALNAPSDGIVPDKSTTGPMIYKNQSVTGQTMSALSGNKIYITVAYWTVTNDDVTSIAEVNYDGTAVVDDTFYPQDMRPGQSVTDSKNNVTTFIGFETLTLAGKTFSNTCHFKGPNTQGDQTEVWYAPGYGMVKQTINGSTVQYNGDLENI